MLAGSKPDTMKHTKSPEKSRATDDFHFGKFLFAFFPSVTRQHHTEKPEAMFIEYKNVRLCTASTKLITNC